MHRKSAAAGSAAVGETHFDMPFFTIPTACSCLGVGLPGLRSHLDVYCTDRYEHGDAASAQMAAGG
jgi:hypothetical protein